MSDLGPRLGNSPYATLLAGIGLARPGTALEFGVGVGTTLGLIADAPHLDPIIGFDSFKGLPEDWRPGWPKGKFARRRPPHIPGTNLMIGLFEETLSALLGGDTMPGWLLNLSLVHVDCDLYSSTATVLHHIGQFLTPGVVIVFDEFHGYPDADQHEARAWAEYVERSGIRWEPVGHGPEQVAFLITS